jgi:hypothetical protein
MVSSTCLGITLPSSRSVPSAFWELFNWGAIDRILWMGVLCLVTWCVAEVFVKMVKVTLISLHEYRERILLKLEHWYFGGCLTDACRRSFCQNAGHNVAFYVVEWSVQTVTRSPIVLVETSVALLVNLTVCIIFEVISLRSTKLNVNTTSNVARIPLLQFFSQR